MAGIQTLDYDFKVLLCSPGLGSEPKIFLLSSFIFSPFTAYPQRLFNTS
jgi:hypothetical protein